MIRALFDLKALAHDTRIILYSMRKVFQRGAVPDKIRFRFKSRLFLVKNRAGEVAEAIRGLTTLTTPQMVYTRREMGMVRAAIRECERYIAMPALAAPQAPAEDTGWLDLPAGVEVELPEPAPLPLEVVTEELDLDLLEIPAGDDEEPSITGPVTEGDAQCPVCGDPDPAERVPCPACGVSYHRECWEYFGGCAIYGCKAAVS